MSDAPAPTRAEDGRTGESGRTMRIMLTDELSRRVKRGERIVIVRDVPWELFGEAGERASQNNHGQSLNRISERGGFSATEALCILTSMSWKQGGSIAEEQAHFVLYAMTAFYRRGALAAKARAAQAEAEVARLTQERDEALCLAEGPSTLLDLARGSVSRGMELHAAEAEVARLTAALTEAEATASLLHKDNERLRWRHPAVLPDWNDLPDGLRAKLARTADGYDPDWGSDLAVNMYAALRQAMMEAPHADK